jgi:pterin-4a-carbinolamine dehydratase
MALLLFVLVLPVFTFPFAPLNSITSRKHEFEADAFAASHSDARDLVSALVKMYEDNASTLTPDPLHSAFYDSHPPASVRIHHLEGLGARGMSPHEHGSANAIARTARRRWTMPTRGLLAQVPDWHARRQAGTRGFLFRDYHETIEFVNALAWMIHREDHHPDLQVRYRHCTAAWTTHSAGHLSR